MPILKYFRLPFHFDAKRLQEEVSRLAITGWQPHFQKLHYEGGWSALPLRAMAGKSNSIYISPHENAEYTDTVFLQECPYLQEVLSSFHCPLGNTRLLKLDAGAVIKEHRDVELCYEKGEIRLHIPVVTHEEVEFYLDGERIYLKEGECWYMNFNLPHSIINRSNTDRIHLVINATVNDWVKELFTQPATDKKEIEEPDYDDDTKLKVITRLRELNTPKSNQLADEMETSIKIEHTRD